MAPHDPISYPIKTARLILRPLTMDDLDDLHKYRQVAEVARYVPFEATDRDGTRKALEQKVTLTELRSEGDTLNLAVVLPGEPDRVIGDVVLFWRSAEHRMGEVGYVISPEFSGHGYATEAATAMLQLGFEHQQFHRIIARLDARNTASARVVERLGMRREAHFVRNEIFKGDWADEVVYAMLEDEWQRS